MGRANISKASKGEGDNSVIIEKVLLLRREKAKLLGFDTFADLSLHSKVGGWVGGWATRGSGDCRPGVGREEGAIVVLFARKWLIRG